MARLADIPIIFRREGALPFLKRLTNEILDDQIFTWAAALAYSWLFAIFPFFIILLSLLPEIVKRLPAKFIDKAETPLVEALYVLLPRRGADALWTNIYDVMHRPRHGLVGLGICVTLWAASGGTSMTMAALDRCYDLKRQRAFYRQRLLAICITIVGAAMLVIALLLLPVASLATAWVEAHRALVEQWLGSHHLNHGFDTITTGVILIWDAIRYVLAIFILLLLLAMVYYFGPATKSRFYLFTPGAIFTLATWLLMGAVFREYVNRFGRYDQMYGALGGVAIVLLFFYLGSAVLLVGAEINSEIDFAMGVPRGSSDFRRIEKPVIVNPS